MSLDRHQRRRRHLPAGLPASCVVFEPMEERRLFSAAPVLAAAPADQDAALAAIAAKPVKHPLEVPAQHSLPGAPVSLYLDFDGDFTPNWGGATPGLTPAFDIDGDTSTFTDGELGAIARVWERVAEMYSPFHIDVTTADPGPQRSEQTMRIVIGGDGAWANGPGGLSEVDSFADPARVNLSWAFVRTWIDEGDALAAARHHGPPGGGQPQELLNEKVLAEIIAHEAGHAFGLQHQRTFNADGSVLSEYNTGDEARAPIMGTAAAAERAVWWLGPAISATELQDDLSVLLRGVNVFGLRPDEAGDTIAAAIDLTPSAQGLMARGVITAVSDVDMYSFTQAAPGHASIRLDVAARAAMLDAAIDVVDEQGAVLASLDTASLGETLTLALPAGRFHVAVRSHGQQGDIGQYHLTVNADVQPPKIGIFLATRQVRPDQVVRLRVYNARDLDGGVQSVRFYLDADRDGQFDLDSDLLLGTVAARRASLRNGLLRLGADQLPFGQNTVFAVPRDNANADGPAMAAVVGVQPPVRLVAEPKVIAAGDRATLTAHDVVIVGQTVSRVTFYHDLNQNGRIDRRDALVGEDADGADGWTVSVQTDGLALGNHEFIAVAHSEEGDTQRPGFASILVNQPPTIEGLTVGRDPESPFGIFVAEVTGIRAAQHPIQRLDLWLDSNGNDLLDPEDQLLHTVNEITGSSATIRFAPGRLLPGVYRLFVTATDVLSTRSIPATTTATMGGG